VSGAAVPSGYLWTTVGSTTVTTVSGENNLVLNGWVWGMDTGGDPGSSGVISCEYLVDGNIDPAGGRAVPSGSWPYGEYSDMSASGYFPVSPGQHTVQMQCQAEAGTSI